MFIIIFFRDSRHFRIFVGLNHGPKNGTRGVSLTRIFMQGRLETEQSSLTDFRFFDMCTLQSTLSI